jgi:hypothetical protein
MQRLFVEDIKNPSQYCEKSFNAEWLVIIDIKRNAKFLTSLLSQFLLWIMQLQESRRRSLFQYKKGRVTGMVAPK